MQNYGFSKVAAARTESSPPPAPWTRHWNERYSRHYYHNPETGVTTWEKPEALARLLPMPEPESISLPATVTDARQWDRHTKMSMGASGPAVARATAFPAAATAAPAASPQRSPWSKYWSVEHQRNYFHNTAVDYVQWEVPPGFNEVVEC